MSKPIDKWIKDGKLIEYAWPGGYPVMYITGQGETICPECAQKCHFDEDEFDSYKPVTGFLYMEGPNIVCEECNRDFESAYGDPEEEEDRRLEEKEAREMASNPV